MTFEKTTRQRLDAITDIVMEARARIGQLGIDQWQKNYPTREIMAEDIRLGRSYVALDEDGSICAVFAVIDDGEPDYDRIFDGAWLTEDGKYLAVHRVAVSAAKLRRGVAGQVMRFAESLAAEMGCESVRIDTHRGNAPMRAMLERNGYVHCGSVYLENGEHRVAYEKRIG